VTVAWRLEPTLRQRLQRQAARQHRTVANLIAHILIEWLKQAESEEKTK